MGEREPDHIPKTQAKLDGGPPRPPKITARGLEDEPPPEESILDEIARRMRRFPSARVQQGPDSIAYIPDARDGFIVRLKVRLKATATGLAEEYHVSFDKCVARFDRRDVAITQFAWGLCNGCRVCERSRGGRPYRQCAEASDLSGTSWFPDARACLWVASFHRFWLQTSVRYLQNDLIDLRDLGQAWAA